MFSMLTIIGSILTFVSFFVILQSKTIVGVTLSAFFLLCSISLLGYGIFQQGEQQGALAVYEERTSIDTLGTGQVVIYISPKSK